MLVLIYQRKQKIRAHWITSIVQQHFFIIATSHFIEYSTFISNEHYYSYLQTQQLPHFLNQTTFEGQNCKSQSIFDVQPCLYNKPRFNKFIILVKLISFKNSQQMEIKQCPILHPTEEQFSKFYQYIHYLDRTYKKDYGMVKVVPPPNWKAQSVDYQKKLENLTVKNAIEQNVQGMGGFFESKNIVQKKMTFKSYRKYSEKESSKVAGKSIEQKEKLFWKTITYSSPIYGADLTGTLMDESAGAWNMNSLDSLLKYAFTQKVKGVTEPYCYIGTWKAFFSWHKEDLDLSAINYIHEGEPKVWYSIAHEDSYVLENAAKNYFKEHYLHCKEFLRHKTFLINPLVLLKEYPEARISKAVHNAGQIMLVFGGAYHCGFNCGFNIAQAVNYATVEWLRQMIHCKPCSCSRKSVKAEKEFILYNLEESTIFEDLLQIDQFQQLRQAVQYQQALQDKKIEQQAADDQKDPENMEDVSLNDQENRLNENIIDVDDINMNVTKIKTSKTKKIEKTPNNSHSQKKAKPSSKNNTKSKKKNEDKSTIEKSKLTSSENIEHMGDNENRGEQIEL